MTYLKVSWQREAGTHQSTGTICERKQKHVATQGQITKKEISGEEPAWEQMERKLKERPGEVINRCTLS